MKKHAHFIGIGGIGISALARYYLHLGYEVTGSDQTASNITEDLESEGIKIVIGESPDMITEETEKVIYTEAIITKPDLSDDENLRNNSELARAFDLSIEALSYPQALGQVVNHEDMYSIAVTGTHGKSTTTSLIGLVFKNCDIKGSVITGTLLKEFGNKNFYFGGSEKIVLEACEYKRAFLNYHPNITVITNIELDHLDYYKDEEDYLDAFRQIQEQTSDYIILDASDSNCQKLKDENKNQIWVHRDHFEINGETKKFPEISMKLPGDHIEFDAKLAYVVGHILGISEEILIPILESYSGAWRRMETVGILPGGNTLMSDYGHHPSEIQPTLASIKEKFPDKELFVIFQPHQYSRTIELLDGFKTCFDSADHLVVPDIYFSRDSKEDVAAMPPERFVQELQENYPQTIYGEGLEKTADLIKKYDQEHPDSSIILLLGAGDADNLRYKLI